MATGRTRAGVRTKTIVVFVVSFVASASFVAVLKAQGASQFTPASSEDPTYRLTNVHVQYPFVRPDGSTTTASAGVAYDLEWSGPSFPGKADCLFRVFDGAGEELGSIVAEVQSLDPSVGGSAPFPVEIAGGVPASATIDCAEAVRAPGVYTLANLSLDDAPGDRVRLIADVGWSSGVLPSVGSCTATFESPTGTDLSWTFSLQAPQGRGLVGTLPSEFVGSSPIGAKCEPYDGSVT